MKIENNMLGQGMDNQMEKRLENPGWQKAIRKVTMPEGMKKELALTGANPKQQKNNFSHVWYGKLLPAACIAVILATTGITAHAFYVNTHLNVFVTHDITSEQLSDLEKELQQMDGISSCRYISGDEAWKEFSETYLTPEQTESFDRNPLADSANLRVGVSLNEDVEKIRKAIEELDGVRLVSGLWED